MMGKILRELSPSDQRKLLIIPFWISAVMLLQLFYPLFEDENKLVFSGLAIMCLLTTITYWVIEFIESLLGKNKPGVIYPNLPYDLFYHYKPKGYTVTGYIYLAKRLADGVYKIGKASNLENRVAGLRREYGPIAIIAVWEVPDCITCERVALDSTQQLEHQELGRQELRAMDDRQCWKFIEDFTKYVAGLEGQMPKVENNDQLPMPALRGES